MVTGGAILILQCILEYITLANPQDTASLFSGNGLYGAIFASSGVLLSHSMYETLEIGWAIMLLEACCAMRVVGIFILCKYGHMLGAKSRFAAGGKDTI